MSTTRTCPSCGAEVSSDQRFCANCGSRMPDPTPVVSPTIKIEPPNVPPTQVIPPLPTGQPTPPSGTSPSGPPGMPLPADPPFTPPPAPRRGLPIWAIALLSLAGLCAFGCVASFFFLSFLGGQVSQVFSTVEIGLSATLDAQATEVSSQSDLPTREPRPTREALPTLAAPLSTEEPAPTEVAVDTDATAQAEDAAAVEATVQAMQAATAEIDQVFANARVVFSDEFVDNRNNWFTGVWNEQELNKIEDGVFKVIWSKNGTSYELYEVRELTNFIAEVDCLVRAGGTDGSCGLVFGQKNDVGFYQFEVFDDYYRLLVVQAEGDPPILTEGNGEGIIRPGDVNRLRVIKEGDRIRVFINGVLLDDVSDATYATGKVGVSTDSYLEEGGVEIWFDNFTVWQLP